MWVYFVLSRRGTGCRAVRPRSRAAPSRKRTGRSRVVRMKPRRGCHDQRAAQHEATGTMRVIGADLAFRLTTSKPPKGRTRPCEVLLQLPLAGSELPDLGKSPARRCSSMVEHQLPKLNTRFDSRHRLHTERPVPPITRSGRFVLLARSNVRRQRIKSGGGDGAAIPRWGRTSRRSSAKSAYPGPGSTVARCRGDAAQGRRRRRVGASHRPSREASFAFSLSAS